MKQSLYEKIKIVVESGNIAICQFDNGDYILFSSMFYRGEGKTPYIRSSNRCNDMNNCYQSLGASYETRYNIDKRNLKYIGIYERPLWRPKDGEFVQILPKAKKKKDFEKSRKIGVPYMVEDSDYSDVYCSLRKRRIVSGDLYPWITVPYDCIAPRVEVG